MDGLETCNDEAFKVAVPACKLEMADEMSLMLHASHMEAKEASKKTQLASALDDYEAIVNKYDDAEERKGIEKDLDTMNAYFSSI